MTAALETGDPDLLLAALGDVARARGRAAVRYGTEGGVGARGEIYCADSMSGT